MRTNTEKTANSVAFPEEILNGKLYFLCSVVKYTTVCDFHLLSIFQYGLKGIWNIPVLKLYRNLSCFSYFSIFSSDFQIYIKVQLLTSKIVCVCVCVCVCVRACERESFRACSILEWLCSVAFCFLLPAHIKLYHKIDKEMKNLKINGVTNNVVKAVIVRKN